MFERGWLSANQVVGLSEASASVVDTGYCSHAGQTVALVEQALAGRPLTAIINTHLHSDHCGGNAALQARYPSALTRIPPGEWAAVTAWDDTRLSYRPTGQTCPRFRADAILAPGSTVELGDLRWDVCAAPGHDPHAVLLFQPHHGILISGDALWQNGFGVVFPELDGADAFDDVGRTLTLIESLDPVIVIPGHGPMFGHRTEVAEAIRRARSRLDQFMTQPERHRTYALKVLMKFKLLEWQQVPLDHFMAWACATPYIHTLHALHAAHEPLETWVLELLDQLVASHAAERSDGWVMNR